LQEARGMLDSGHTNTAVNRMYYACFYAVTALLLIEGLHSAKHSRVRSLLTTHDGGAGLSGSRRSGVFSTSYSFRGLPLRPLRSP
jgi:uncharacterized protein (UPF0332 family)